MQNSSAGRDALSAGLGAEAMEALVNVSDIACDGRIRSELGEIDALANSIREHGLIQPIVLIMKKAPPGSGLDDENGVETPTLVAGGRRLSALKILQYKALRHGKEFIWRDEVLDDAKPEIALKMQAIEIEENVRRKELTWQEQVLGKKRLLEIMQKIHGVASAGRPTKGQAASGDTGFSVRKLAAMLGESVQQVAKDIQIAEVVQRVPALRSADTKESAFRQMGIAATVFKMQRDGAVQDAKDAAAQAAANVSSTDASGASAQPAKEKGWILHEGSFSGNAALVPNETADLVYTDLPFGVDLANMSKHRADGVVSYRDSRESVVADLSELARQSFRVLRPDRYAIFWFGFNYYTDLVNALRDAGFAVNPVPFVWFKNSRSTEDPNRRYANSYDPALICAKGRPMFIRPGQQNFVQIPPVSSSNRLQIAQQPVELVTKFLQDMTVPGATVVDFCAGSGTTGEAAVREKRRVILFERDSAACVLIRARLGALGA